METQTPQPVSPPEQPVVQIAPPPPAPVKSNNLLLISLVILAILLSFGTAAFISYQNVQQKKQVAQITPFASPKPTAEAGMPDSTANWKTYTNTTWNYSFKYPPQWGVSSGGGDVVSLMSNAEDLAAMEKYQNTPDQGPFTYPSDDYGQITFSVYKKGVNTAAGMVTDQTDIRSFVQKMFNTQYSSITDVTLDGKPAIEFVSDELVEKPGLPPHMQSCPPDQAPCLIPSGRKTKQVWTKMNGNLLYIIYSQGGTYKDIDKLPALFTQILSTFKFTNNDTTDIPAPIANLFEQINSNFKLTLVPVAENQFYSPSGMITKKSWKLDFTNTTIGKSLTSFLLTKLQANNEGGDVGGGGIIGYENTLIKCFHSYGYRSGNPEHWTDPFNYLSCVEK